MAGEMNLNYPSSSGYLKMPQAPPNFGAGDIAGSLQTSGTAKGAITGNPALAAAGLATDVIGTGFNIYNSITAADQAEKNYELALKAYEDEKRRKEEQDKINLEQLKLGNIYSGAEYANKLREQGGQTQNYYQSTGA